DHHQPAKSPGEASSSAARRTVGFCRLVMVSMLPLLLMFSLGLLGPQNAKRPRQYSASGALQAFYTAALAFSTRAVNAASSAMAISDSIFRFRVTPAFFKPFIKVE